MKSRAALKHKINTTLIYQLEPKKIDEALKDNCRVQAMQKKLDQIEKSQVWTLVPT